MSRNCFYKSKHKLFLKKRNDSLSKCGSIKLNHPIAPSWLSICLLHGFAAFTDDCYQRDHLKQHRWTAFLMRKASRLFRKHIWKKVLSVCECSANFAALLDQLLL